MKTKEERQAVADALEAVATKHGGLLTPDAVVKEAANTDSVLHGEFDWSDKKAAHFWRIEQARVLIRSVRVLITTEKTSISTVAYVRDPDLQSDEQGYVSTISIVSDKERSRSVLVMEFSRAAAALRRARELAVVFDMVDEIDAATESVETMRTKIEATVEQHLQ